ncbi:unnamed protein product [Cyprideis torosa]|uniref:Uncharacterized protein n=1 Tax=Cyprideis torosa TaxID=163714 RepID=A0A7R8W5A2_9CRUS|nr:unnamed protein product [Cyprideis torosa]CAG0884945.1 unnamed protein product [Cyprideis torosa]
MLGDRNLANRNSIDDQAAATGNPSGATTGNPSGTSLTHVPYGLNLRLRKLIRLSVAAAETATSCVQPCRHWSLVDNRGRQLKFGDFGLKLKKFQNGAEVIIKDRKAARSSGFPAGLTTVMDFMGVSLPYRKPEFQNFLRSARPEFETKTYYTTVTYYTQPTDGGDIQSRTEVISNVVTQEVGGIYIDPSPTTGQSAQVTVTEGTEDLADFYDVHTLVTKFTYYNTLFLESEPVVLSSTETVANVATVARLPGSSDSVVIPSGEATKTYLNRYIFYKTVTEDNQEKIFSKEEVITQVVVTRVEDVESIEPTPIDEGVSKTFFTTFTYLTTALMDGETIVNR